MNFTEPELKTVNSYYKVKSQDMLRVRQFDCSIKHAERIKEKVEVQDGALDILDANNILIQKKSKPALRLAYNEYMADKHYKKLVEFYITKGKKDNPYNFLVLDLDRTDKHTLKFQDLLSKAKSELLLHSLGQFAPMNSDILWAYRHKVVLPKYHSHTLS